MRISVELDPSLHKDVGRRVRINCRLSAADCDNAAIVDIEFNFANECGSKLIVSWCINMYSIDADRTVDNRLKSKSKRVAEKRN